MMSCRQTILDLHLWFCIDEKKSSRSLKTFFAALFAMKELSLGEFYKFPRKQFGMKYV